MSCASSGSTWSSSTQMTIGAKLRIVPQGSMTLPRTMPLFMLNVLGAAIGVLDWFCIVMFTRTGAPIGTALATGVTNMLRPSISSSMSVGLIGVDP